VTRDPSDLDLTQHAPNLERVKGSIAPLVLEFARSRLELGCPVFRIADLQHYVEGRARAAPASPDRVLRALRREGRLSYEVLSRPQSLYRVLGVQ
jgi:hypothetical protein